ncbi:hypothetical protein GF339_11965 [candidate division KSB3 bacterium]|uniref:Uncharacterized protein n=1 Tax=candidate division KSB3 bacterium TaxID=2044937 RepID=A0A9D5JWA4_9BACT|nr:hypothetical protein [candidate division KSB3 bacterium]MBD3325295.1 hypothetical protein [candidate division KSB3 bacterium]
MKNLIVLLALCCTLQVAGNSPPAWAEVIDKIAAVLDEDLVFLSELREEAESPVVKLLLNLDTTQNTTEDRVLPYVIERHLLLQAIQYLAPPKNQDLTMSLALRYLSNTYHDTEAPELEQQLEAAGISESALETEIMPYLKGIDYIRRKYRFTADIDAPEVVLNLFQQWINDLKAQTDIRTLL